jgi:hypothetical protein
MSVVGPALVSGVESTRRRIVKHAVVVGLGSALFGAIAGPAAAGGQVITLIALVPVFVLLAAVWVRPQLGPMLLLATGLLIEQFPIGLTNGSTSVGVPITQRIPAFVGLGSFHLEPTDLFPVAVLIIYMIRSSGDEIRWWPRTQLSLAVAAMIGAVLFGEINGLMHHADIRWSLFECRPFIYFGAAYLLTSVIIRTRSTVYGLLWVIVVAEIIKSVQGIDVWIVTRGWTPEPQNVLGHEEAMFFSLDFFVVAALWLFGLRGRLRKVATYAAPLVLFADLVNDRRAAWLVLPFGLIVMAVIGYRVLPHRRRVLGGVMAVTALAAAVYLPAFWNHTDGTLGKPADAVRSQFAPTPRDALSDEYRADENANLKFNIVQDGVLGAGFGRMIDYALPMPGLVTAQDAGITYVPHNTLLYVLMRMGLIGGTAFWAMLGAAIIAGCRLASCPDRLLAAVGTIAVAATVGWSFEGSVDIGFSSLRMTIVMGCVVGLLEASRHIHEASRSSSTLTFGQAPVPSNPAHLHPGSSIRKKSPRHVVG